MCYFQVQAFLQPPMEAVVIQSYGAGNGPDAREDLINLFHEASQRGMLILNITQCQRGMVSTSYATGKVRFWGAFTSIESECEMAVSYRWVLGN